MTGASSGIGKMITSQLAQKGHLIYACARKKEDIKALNEIDNVISFRLDVTDPTEVKQAFEFVKTEGRGLYALINNAGVGESWPAYATDETMLHRVFNVNVYGPLRVTNALISFLIESKGRIVNISSVAGLVTPIYMATYSMSKYAIESWSNALEQELEMHDVKVSLIEPGNYATNIVRSSTPYVRGRIQEAAEGEFANDIQEMVTVLRERNDVWKSVPTPEEVIEAIMDALFNANPKPRYLVISKEETDLFTEVLQSKLIELSQLFKDNTHGVTKQDLLNLFNEII